jgi:serine protease Do
MKMRNLLTLFAIVLLTSATSAVAQRTPPSPTTPPAPPSGITTPVPQVFSFSFEGNAYLGVSPENITKENMSQYGLNSPRGVGISNVSQGSPAERAGLKKGDVILQFDGEPVTSTRKLLRLIGEAGPEQSVRLTISRSGAEQQVNVTLGQREPVSRAFGVNPPDWDGYFRTIPPTTPRAPRGYAPEVFSYSFGNNRRVGITTTALTKQLADFFGVSGGQGLLISSISENSPASKAGLRAGDVITEVDGEKIEDSGDFIRALNKKEEGEVTLTIIRDKSQRTIRVMPEKRATPSINLTELQAMPMASNMIPLGRSMNLMKLPDVRALHALPRIESFVMPKLDGSTLPRLMNLPRVELLQTIPREL